MQYNWENLIHEKQINASQIKVFWRSQQLFGEGFPSNIVFSDFQKLLWRSLKKLSCRGEVGSSFKDPYMVEEYVANYKNK